jgi:lysozyme
MALLDVVIDVSDAQGTIDWPRVAAAGIRVAMVKATQGASFTAHTWAGNRDGATNAGIAVIPYHFMTSDDDPAVQAQHFATVAGLSPGAAYALDWEGANTASPAQMDAVGEALAAIAGRNPLGYWGIPGSTPTTPSASMQTWDRWVPRYRVGNIADFTQMPSHFTTPFNPPDQPFKFWQYTAGGAVDGIAGAVDRSVGSFDSAAALIAWVRDT